MQFQDMEAGEEFYLDGRCYQKLTKYTALLLRSASGKTPMRRINRMVHPAESVETVGRIVA